MLNFRRRVLKKIRSFNLIYVRNVTLRNVMDEIISLAESMVSKLKIIDNR